MSLYFLAVFNVSCPPICEDTEMEHGSSCFSDLIEHATELSLSNYKWIEAYNLMAILVRCLLYITHQFLFISSTKHDKAPNHWRRNWKLIYKTLFILVHVDKNISTS